MVVVLLFRVHPFYSIVLNTLKMVLNLEFTRSKKRLKLVQASSESGLSQGCIIQHKQPDLLSEDQNCTFKLQLKHPILWLFRYEFSLEIVLLVVQNVFMQKQVYIVAFLFLRVKNLTFTNLLHNLSTCKPLVNVALCED